MSRISQGYDPSASTWRTGYTGGPWYTVPTPSGETLSYEFGGPDPGLTLGRTCVDTDNGALDSIDKGCADYEEWIGPGNYIGSCSNWDDDDFIAADMCCECGGGLHEWTSPMICLGDGTGYVPLSQADCAADQFWIQSTGECGNCSHVCGPPLSPSAVSDVYSGVGGGGEGRKERQRETIGNKSHDRQVTFLGPDKQFRAGKKIDTLQADKCILN